MKKKISKNPMRRRAYKPQPKTVKKFTSTFRTKCVKEGLSIASFGEAVMWDEMENLLGEMLKDFIKKSPIV